MSLKQFINKPAAIVATSALVILAGASTVSAANNSVPGDLLYGLDTALESLKVSMARSETSKAAAHLEVAEEKLHELQTLVTKGKAAEHIATAASRMAEHGEAASAQITLARAGGKDVAKLQARLAENSARQQSILRSVLGKVPEQAQSAIKNAMEVSSRGLENASQQQNRIPGSNRGSSEDNAD